MTKPQIDYFFGVGSPWSYIGLEPFLDLIEKYDLTVRPYIIALIEENGGIYAKDRPEARRNYWQSDLKRWASFRGKTLNFTNRSSLAAPGPANPMILAAVIDGLDWLSLTHALQSAFWEKSADIGVAAVRVQLANAAGFDGDALEKRASDRDVQSAWTSNHEVAKDAGVFGMPTWRYEGELYWGQDSLYFLERHLQGKKIG